MPVRSSCARDRIERGPRMKRWHGSSPIRAPFGITRVANVTGLDRIGLPVVLATRPNSRSVAVSQGKGTSLDGREGLGGDGGDRAVACRKHPAPMIFASRSEIDRCGTVDRSRAIAARDGSRYSESLRMHWIEGTTSCPASRSSFRMKWCTPITPTRFLRATAAFQPAPTALRRATIRSRPSAMPSAK